MLRVGERVSVFEFRVVDAVDDHRHLRHADGREVYLLPFDGDGIHLAARFRRRADQQRSRPARHVVDGDHRAFILCDVDDPRHHAAHFAGGVELTLGLAGLRGEVLHQILVGVANEVIVCGAVVGKVEILVLEDADQVRDRLHEVLALAQLLLVGKVRVRDRIGQLFVRLADTRKNHVHALADVRLALKRHQVVEGTTLGQVDIEVGVTVLRTVADVLDEEDDQHIVLVLACVHAAAQFVARLPELCVQLGFLDGHFFSN